MANDNDKALPTTGIIAGKTTTLPTPTRSYAVGPSFGPLARSLGNTETTILAEIKRGGDQDRGYGAKR